MQNGILKWCLAATLGLFSCTEVTDIIVKPSAREVYQREFEEDHFRFSAWEAAYEESLTDSLLIELPFQLAGYFVPRNMTVYSYNIALAEGQILNFEVETDSTNIRVFIDFYELKGDSEERVKYKQGNEPLERHFQFEVNKTALYKIVVQPEIAANTPFLITAYSSPTLGFPVAGKGNKDILSFWGAPRDGGARRHEGIDIFAPRGTPVVASADGRVTFVGKRGLGGKQVWLRSGLLDGYSLYYAHLDSIAVSIAQRVKRGDTLGFVGNTGNARFTSPHLHFGIYKTGGAVDPLSYVYISERPETEEPFSNWKDMLVVQSSVANLRQAASLNGDKIGRASRGDTLYVLGKTETWWHVETFDDFEAFIHNSTVR